MATTTNSPPLLPLLFALLLQASVILSSDSCTESVDIPELSFSASSLSCQAVWPSFNFILRHYYDESSKTLSVVLSAAFQSNWIAMGLSPSGMMVGSSAMVGYTSAGVGAIDQYYLAGTDTNDVLPKEGNLSVVPNSKRAYQSDGTLYIAFQLTSISNASAASSRVIYAFGARGNIPNETGYITEMHQDRLSMSFDFTTGVAANPTNSLRRNHGVVNIFGWAVLAPIGAFIARYFRQWDPAWLYLHMGFQITGFLCAIAGVALGIKLTQELSGDDWHNHRALGLFVFVLGILQVMALCAKPQKDSKYRKAWNWYHHWVGRLVLLLAAVNIVVGLRLADAGSSWKAGYATVLLVTLIAFIILETVFWYRWMKHRRDPARTQAPAFSSYEMM